MKVKFCLDSGVDINFLKDSFPELDFYLFKAKIDDFSFYSVISCYVDNEETLKNIWERINNLVGAEYLTIMSDFSSWNIYLAFLSSNKIGNALKYTIENDTFFVRKIIFDNQSEQLAKEQLENLFNNQILGGDIRVDMLINLVELNGPKYSRVTQNLLNAKLPLGRTNKDKDLRNAWLDSAILEVSNHEI